MTRGTSRARILLVAFTVTHAVAWLAVSHAWAAEPTARRHDASAASATSAEALRALPYLRWGRVRADPEQAGVVTLDRRRRQPGYDLVIGTVGERLVLRSATGRAIHGWRIPARERWVDAQLTADGTLLVLAVVAPRATTTATAGDAPATASKRFLVWRSWDGFERKRIRLGVHHTFAQQPEGGLLTLTSRRRTTTLAGAETEVIDNPLVALGASGAARGIASLLDLWRAWPDAPALLPVAPRAGTTSVDLLHANAVWWLADGDRRGAFAGTTTLVTLRHQDTVLGIDWPARRIAWQWGRGVLSGPHDAQRTPEGKLLVFDNGLAHRRSRVLEVDLDRALHAPDTAPEAAVVWRFPRPGHDDPPFFTASGGACRRFANGNTLIVSTNEGRAFEVTPDGEVVWDFYNPEHDARGHRGTIVRVRRYDPDWIQGLLQRSD